MHPSTSVDINGERIRQLREEKELTQLYLATVVGVTTDTISRWENRRYPTVKLDNAKKLAEALEVPLEELLETRSSAAEAVEESVPAPVIEEVPAGAHQLFSFSGIRKDQLAFLAAAILLAALLVFFILGQQSDIKAKRIAPTHTAPGTAFPVLIQVVGPVEAVNTLLVRDEISGEAEASGMGAEQAMKQFGKNPRWIGKLDQGKASFLYLVLPSKKGKLDDALRFNGDIISKEGQLSGLEIGGVKETTLAPFHWVDSNRDLVISDSEILKAHELFSLPGMALVDFSAIEELWLAGGYSWNKKTMLFEARKVDKQSH